MAKRIIVHVLSDCSGCDATFTELADGELINTAGRVQLRPISAPGELPVRFPSLRPPQDWITVTMNKRSYLLCPACAAKVEGVFKADVNKGEVLDANAAVNAAYDEVANNVGVARVRPVRRAPPFAEEED